MTPAGIEPATFRFVARHLNHCATAVPSQNKINYTISSPPEQHSTSGGETCSTEADNTILYRTYHNIYLTETFEWQVLADTHSTFFQTAGYTYILHQFAFGIVTTNHSLYTVDPLLSWQQRYNPLWSSLVQHLPSVSVHILNPEFSSLYKKLFLK